MTSVKATLTHNSLPEDYSHAEGHNNQILLRCCCSYLAAGVRGEDGTGDGLELPHLAEREPHGALGRAQQHGHGLRAQRREPGGRRTDRRRADCRVRRQTRRPEARDLARWRWTYRCGGSQTRDIWARAHKVRGMTAGPFVDFVTIGSKTGSKQRDVPRGEREPLMESSQLSTADDLWFFSNRVGGLPSERVREWVREGKDGHPRTFTCKIFVCDQQAKLPRGVHNIRPHLEQVDNVPLLVPMFTDCSPAGESTSTRWGVWRHFRWSEESFLRHRGNMYWMSLRRHVRVTWWKWRVKSA